MRETSIKRRARAALGRIELDADDPRAGAQRARQLGLALLLRDRGGQHGLAGLEDHARAALLVDRAADRRDLRGRRAAAAADDARPECARLGRELGEVLGRRVGIDDAAADDRDEADVRQRRERQVRVAHRGERVERGVRAGAVVVADRRHVEPGQPGGGLGGADAARGLGVLVEREQRHDRQRGDAAHGRDGDLERVEVEEGLEHEEVDAAAFEDQRLLGVERPVLVDVEHLELAQRADRAGDEDVAAGDLARLAGEPHRGRVDALEVVAEPVRGEIAPVGAERVRLDQLGAGADVARVHGDDALRRHEVRLLGTAQAGNGLEQGAEAAVGDDRRAAAQALGEVRHRRLPDAVRV